ncbi:hypothetical protein PBY51_020659 [Eleginops maclovinus]|uniref:Uncharacterized protein n=1 Tax=Eleginops maclovinus TaxID=56733 RepID=A0AAN7XV07_ELEMC|nr:hypothetical protein PBY51_020659 [Eleginops maclovinus]
MHDGHCHSASRVTSLFSPLLCLGENINAVVLLADIHTTPTPFNEIHQLRTPYGETDDNSRKKKGRKERYFLIRNERDRVESDNMQRDEAMCVLDVGKKKGGEESKAAARCGVMGSGAGSSLLWQSVDFRPQF